MNLKFIMVRRFLLVVILFFPSLCSARALWQPIQITQQGTVGTVNNVVLIPSGVTFSFCNYPANGAPCMNNATTYTDATATTQCDTSAPFVLNGGSSCVANLDRQDQGGVWVKAGKYTYTVTINGTAQGPYYVAVGADPTAATTFIGNLTAVGDTLSKSGRPWFDVRAFGAVGNDTADDTASMQAAINGCRSNGGVVHFAAGIYKHTTSLFVHSNNCDLLFERGAKLDFCPTAPFVSGTNGQAILIGGSEPSLDRAISGTISAGAASFTASSSSSTTDLVANDWLLIYIKDPTLDDAVRIDFAQVASVSGGTTVNLAQPLQQNFSPSRGQTLNFQRMDANGPGPVQNVRLIASDIIMNIAGQSGTPCDVGVYWARNVWMMDNTLEVFPGTTTANAVCTFRSQGVHFNGNKIIGRGTAASGVQAEFAETVNLEVRNNVIETEPSSAALPYLTLDFGTSKFSVTNNKLNNINNFGFLVYAGTHDGVIANNTVGLVSGQQKGTNFLGMQDVVVKNNVFLGPATNNSAGSQCLSAVNDTNPSVTIMSTRNVFEGNKCGTQHSFQTNYVIPNSDDLLITTDVGNATTKSNLTVRGIARK
jgi:Pectate lyase superfamily protein